MVNSRDPCCKNVGHAALGDFADIVAQDFHAVAVCYTDEGLPGGSFSAASTRRVEMHTSKRALKAVHVCCITDTHLSNPEHVDAAQIICEPWERGGVHSRFRVHNVSSTAGSIASVAVVRPIRPDGRIEM